MPKIIIDPEAREILYLVASVRLSVSALTAEPFAECGKEQRRVIIRPRCLSVCQIVARMRLLIKIMD